MLNRPHAARSAKLAGVWAVAALVVTPLVGETPPTAVAQLLVEATPGAVATAIIETLGAAAQPVAVVAGLFFLITAGTVAGVVLAWLGRVPEAAPVRAALWLVGTAVVLGVVSGDPLASLLATPLVAGPPLLLAQLSEQRGTDIARRGFLRRAGATGVALAGASAGAAGLSQLLGDGTGPQPGQNIGGVDAEQEKTATGRTVVNSTTATPTAGADGGADSVGGDGSSSAMGDANRQPVTVTESDSTEPFGFDFAGMPGAFTPLSEHYVVDKEVVDPDVDMGEWNLDVDGGVGESLSYSLSELAGHPDSYEQAVTMVCISNPVAGPLVSTLRWEGVPLNSLLEEAGVAGDTIDVVTQGADGYTESLPWEVIRDRDDVMLAYAVNGKTLPTQHGFPLRLLIPGRYWMKSTKWVRGVGAVDYDFKGYWNRRGWDEEAPVSTTAAIRAAQRRGDRVALGGFAYAGVRGIDRVAVSLDGGDSWREATLTEPLDGPAWRRFRVVVDREPGAFEAIVRAVDGTGTIQPATESSPHPDGATGWHRVSLEL